MLLLAGVAPGRAQEMSPPAPPNESDLAPWLGRYQAGPEVLAVTWSGGPTFHLGLIEIPMDGLWHETVATFSVRHRVSWDPEHERIRFEEQHNQGAHWVYEYALDGEDLVKLVPAGAQGNAHEVVKRRYRRTSSN